MRGPPRRTSERRFVPQRLRRKVPNPNGRRVGRCTGAHVGLRHPRRTGSGARPDSTVGSLVPIMHRSAFRQQLVLIKARNYFLPSPSFPSGRLLSSSPPKLKSSSLPPRLGFRFLPRPSTTQAAVAAWKQSHLVALDFPAAARLSFLFGRSPAGPPIA